VELLDNQVLDTIKSGNENAYEMIFKSYYQPLCRYAYTFLHDKEESEEVVQSVFISLWEKRSMLDIQTSFKAYLFRMVRNSCLNVIKHEKVKKQHVAHEMAVAEVSYNSVAEKVSANELSLKITEAMKALPEQCRMVFQLSRFEELKYQEIADQLNISIKTVENHMGKALKIMREQLKDYLPLFLIFMKDFI
jgi:RNA polymerase sigma-70 factor (ECF subfamily)